MIWHETNGGPFVLAPRGALAQWSGAEGDYDRACAVDGFAAVVALSGGAAGLVLGDEPLATAYLPEHRVLVRWCYADDEDGVAEAIIRMLPEAPWGEGAVLWIPGPLVMFDAAYLGSEVGTLTDGAAIELSQGRYRVDSAFVEPDSTARFLLHRFVELV